MFFFFATTPLDINESWLKWTSKRLWFSKTYHIATLSNMLFSLNGTNSTKYFHASMVYGVVRVHFLRVLSFIPHLWISSLTSLETASMHMLLQVPDHSLYLKVSRLCLMKIACSAWKNEKQKIGLLVIEVINRKRQYFFNCDLSQTFRDSRLHTRSNNLRKLLLYKSML